MYLNEMIVKLQAIMAEHGTDIEVVFGTDCDDNTAVNYVEFNDDDGAVVVVE